MQRTTAPNASRVINWKTGLFALLVLLCTLALSAKGASAALPSREVTQAGPNQQQGSVPQSHSAGSSVDKLALAAPAAPFVTLYDQYNNLSGGDVTSQQFEAASSAYNSQAADDFVVPSGQNWSVTEVDAAGTVSAIAPTLFNVYFYSNSGTLPATPVYTATNVTATQPTTSTFAIPLNTPAALTGGATYWVSVQARLDFTGGGQWYWKNRSVVANNPAAWRNPGNGFGTGCTAWGVKTTCLTSQNGADQVYRLVGNVVPQATATATACPMNFSDVHPTDYFYADVQCVYCQGAISGYADGTFRPFNNTTRGQMTKIIVLALNFAIVTPTGTPTFNDVPTSNPFYSYIETAVYDNIVSGYADGTFRPNANVTRGQLSKIVVQGAGHIYGWTLITPMTPTFSDVPTTNPFYAYIETAVCHQAISGYADGTFRPNNNATRAQIAKIVCRTTQNLTCATR